MASVSGESWTGDSGAKNCNCGHYPLYEKWRLIEIAACGNICFFLRHFFFLVSLNKCCLLYQFVNNNLCFISLGLVMFQNQHKMHMGKEQRRVFLTAVSQ